MSRALQLSFCARRRQRCVASPMKYISVLIPRSTERSPPDPGFSTEPGVVAFLAPVTVVATAGTLFQTRCVASHAW